MAGRKRSSGCAVPFSQWRSAVEWQPIASAACLCDKARSRRARRRCSPKVFGSSE